MQNPRRNRSNDYTAVDSNGVSYRVHTVINPDFSASSATVVINTQTGNESSFPSLEFRDFGQVTGISLQLSDQGRNIARLRIHNGRGDRIDLDIAPGKVGYQNADRGRTDYEAVTLGDADRQKAEELNGLASQLIPQIATAMAGVFAEVRQSKTRQ